MKNFQRSPLSDTILYLMRIATKLVRYMYQSVMMVTTYIHRCSLKVIFCHFWESLVHLKFVRTYHANDSRLGGFYQIYC